MAFTFPHPSFNLESFAVNRQQVARARKYAKPLGLMLLAVIAAVLVTTMEWGVSSETREATPVAGIAGSPLTHAIAGGLIDLFYEQKKAASTEELPDQF